MIIVGVGWVNSENGRDGWEDEGLNGTCKFRHGLMYVNADDNICCNFSTDCNYAHILEFIIY